VKSHGGEDDSTGLMTEHSLDHTAHAVRTASGVLAPPLQQKQSGKMGSRPVPHLVFIGRQVSRIQAEGPEVAFARAPGPD
jgi:hypothetical protein